MSRFIWDLAVSMPESPLRYAARLIEGCPDSIQKQWALSHLARVAARYGDCAETLLAWFAVKAWKGERNAAT